MDQLSFVKTAGRVISQVLSLSCEKPELQDHCDSHMTKKPYNNSIKWIYLTFFVILIQRNLSTSVMNKTIECSLPHRKF